MPDPPAAGAPPPAPPPPAASPAWDPATDCRKASLPGPRTRVDLDGDGTPDRISHDSGSGSWEGGDHITLDLSRAGRVELDFIHPFSEMLRRFPIPPALQGPELKAAREAVAAVLSETLCDTPDPSMRWLLREPRTIEWIEGAPPLDIPYYVMIDEPSAQWRVYAGHMHTISSGARSHAEPISDGAGRTLRPTAHGVILIEGDRHAWIYARERSEGKLRWPSVAGLVLERPGRLRIEREPILGEEVSPVWVDLTAGAVSGLGGRE